MAAAGINTQNYNMDMEIDNDNDEQQNYMLTTNAARQFLPPFIEYNEFFNRSLVLGVDEQDISVLYLHYLIIYGKWNDFMFHASHFLAQFQEQDEREQFLNTTFNWFYKGGNLFFTCALWNAPRDVLDFLHNEGGDISMENNDGEFAEDVITNPYYEYPSKYLGEDITNQGHVNDMGFLCDHNDVTFTRDINDFEDVRHYIAVLSGEEAP